MGKNEWALIYRLALVAAGRNKPTVYHSRIDGAVL